ncbi:hypothetical protein HJG60_011724 [Phyllostomus discolor]|uniref:Uncharacterized protein n=1 Tax=Phyllostomus discolor TaxID=89673 RepID=A0A833ZVY4_9CHIR|nr:hypothetical protein HJG60_011724 [Phyllostomus discolor]
MHTVLPAPSTWQKGTLPKPRGPYSHLSLMAPTKTPKPRGPKQTCGPKKRDAQWLLCLRLNPSANLPLQPHFRLLSHLATAASILGRCGPVVWSQLSPSSSGPYYKSLFGALLLPAPCYTSRDSPHPMTHQPPGV